MISFLIDIFSFDFIYFSLDFIFNVHVYSTNACRFFEMSLVFLGPAASKQSVGVHDAACSPRE